jgi:D-sedoheptulose 7-phosphate isomerase
MKLNKFNDYLKDYFSILNKIDKIQLEKILKKLESYNKKHKGNIWIFGNGGSHATSSHIATDFTKNTKIKMSTISDANQITCFSNDYGYENWISTALKKYASKKDLVILVSSSGNSQNIINAAKFCKNNKVFLITLTGFNKKNKLNPYGNLSLWIDSKSYNFVELAHLQILTYLVDKIAKIY